MLRSETPPSSKNLSHTVLLTGEAFTRKVEYKGVGKLKPLIVTPEVFR